MKKYQEVLDEVFEVIEKNIDYENVYVSKQVLQELVNRATPMKVLTFNSRKFEYDIHPVLCPDCKNLLYETYLYCPYCGRKLEWSE